MGGVMRGVDVVRASAGAAALARPEPLTRLAHEHRDAVRVGARLLGARWLVQAFGSGLLGRRRAARAGVAVDVLHAASMLAAARRWPGAAAPALLSAGVAVALAVADVRSLPSPSISEP